MLDEESASNLKRGKFLWQLRQHTLSRGVRAATTRIASSLLQASRHAHGARHIQVSLHQQSSPSNEQTFHEPCIALGRRIQKLAPCACTDRQTASTSPTHRVREGRARVNNAVILKEDQSTIIGVKREPHVRVAVPFEWGVHQSMPA